MALNHLGFCALQAVATSHPLSSSPEGNNWYRSFVGGVYELYSAGGSLECRNVLSVGHEEIRRCGPRHHRVRGTACTLRPRPPLICPLSPGRCRRIVADGVEDGPVGR